MTLRGRTLLVADDSVTIQRVIELTFAGEDIRVVAVSDGASAIAAMEQSPPDIVLADVGMPGQNGYDIARYVKSSPALAHIPVVLLTGAFEPVDTDRMRDVGSDGVLAKPFEPQVVIARVKELLTRPRGAGAEPRAPAADVRPRADEAPAETPADREQFFDRLDTALSQRAGIPRVDPVEATNARGSTELSSHAVPPHAPPASPPPPPGAMAARPDVPPPGTAAPSPTERSAPAGGPSLADAFAALLAAEQAMGTPLPPAGWPASSAVSDAVIEEIVERVTTRVLGQLSDRVVRETVAGIAADSAERLVREEIQRIKKESGMTE